MARKKTSRRKTKKQSYRQQLYYKAKSLGFSLGFVGVPNNVFENYIYEIENPEPEIEEPEIDIDELDEFIQSSDSPDGAEFNLEGYNLSNLKNILRKMKYKRKKYKYFLIIDNGRLIYTISYNFLMNKKNEFDENSDDFYQDLDIDRINSIVIKKEKIRVNARPSSAFLPYVLTDRILELAKTEPDFQYLVDTYNKYVPNEDTVTDCVGNSIKLLEHNKIIPKGSFDKYVAFRLVSYKTFDIRQKDWEDLSALLQINIIIHKVEDKITKILRYPKVLKNTKNFESKGIMELYSFDDHVFLYEKTEFSKFSVITNGGYSTTHYQAILDKIASKRNAKKEQHIYNTSYNAKLKNPYSINARDKLTSMDFVRLIIDNPDLTTNMPEARILDQINYKHDIDHNSDLLSGFENPTDRETITEEGSVDITLKKAGNPFINKFNKKGDYIKIFADFETIRIYKTERKKVKNTKKYENVEVAYNLPDMLVVQVLGQKPQYYTIRNKADKEAPIAKSFLEDINNGVFGTSTSNFMVIFHNLGYDFNFIAQTPGLQIINRLAVSASKLKCAMTRYGSKNIYFKDSYSVIPNALSDFERIFKLKDIKKGACPYNYYTLETIDDEYASKAKARKYVKSKDMDDFISSIQPYTKKSNKNYYNHYQHRIDYCVQDVNILAQGYEEFRKWTRDIFDEELDFLVSIPQLAFNYVYNQGTLDGVCPVSGVALAYLQKFIVGGRCMSAFNKKYKVNKVQDFDAASLYPSGMVRFDFKVPKGKPRQLDPTSDECINFDPSKYVSFNVSVTILSHRKKERAFPCLYVRDEDRGFVNDPTPEEILYLSKITLEDAVKYHDIKYKVLGGLVWDNSCGSNDGLGKCMIDLFNIRNKFKAEKNPAQELVKLIMNSIYGRMLMKPHDTNEKFFTKYKPGESNYEKYEDYTHRHYNHISGISENDNMAIVTKYKSVLSHSNYSHVGSNILDISKRIMNEVMFLAEDKNIKIYYQDTDSMHIKADDLPKLKSEFQKAFGREIEGNALGQFKSDFKIPETEEFKGYKDPYAELTIICGKKCYFDLIVCENDKGERKYFEHSRMKGIPKYSIEDRCIKDNCSTKILYERLYKGEEVEFDMLADNGVSFEFRDDFSVVCNLDFTRSLKF